jgi:peptide/nickel transport system substrate-binding protein
MKAAIRNISLVILAIIVALISGSAALAQDETVLVIGHAEATDSLDPARGYTQTSGVIFKATYETLVTFPDDSASEVLPQLATEWTVSDDGLTYTFTLAEGVTFSSGNPMTAADVVYSFNRLKALASSPAFLAENIASVEAVDDMTVAITLNTVSPSFLSELANSAFSVSDSVLIQENGGFDPAAVATEDPAATEEAAAVAVDDTAESFLNNTSAGTGPYVLEMWEPQVQTVLVRNPNWRGDAPYFDRVIITNIVEAATQQISLEAGDIDLALDLTSDQINALEGNSEIAIARGPANITHFLLMNADPEIGGPVSDPNVQLAIRYALDYEGYVTLWGGVAPASNLAYGIAGSLEPSEALTRDLDMARQLLADAGYPDGFDITLSYPDFSFQGVNMNTNAQKIQADLAEVGINVTLEPGELQVSLEEYRTGQQGFGYWFWGPDKLDPVDYQSFLPGGKVALERANWGTEGVDQEVVDMISQAATESDQETRLELYRELQRWMQQNGVFAPFNQPDIQTAFRSDIQGYVWHPQWLLDVALLSRAE